jgi:hypothetical protein
VRPAGMCYGAVTYLMPRHGRLLRCRHPCVLRHGCTGEHVSGKTQFEASAIRYSAARQGMTGPGAKQNSFTEIIPLFRINVGAHLDEWLGHRPQWRHLSTFGYRGMTLGRSARSARSKFALK